MRGAGAELWFALPNAQLDRAGPAARRGGRHLTDDPARNKRRSLKKSFFAKALALFP